MKTAKRMGLVVNGIAILGNLLVAMLSTDWGEKSYRVLLAIFLLMNFWIIWHLKF